MPFPVKAERPSTAAFVIPFILFLVFLVLPDLFAVKNPKLPWWKNSPELWIYPIQTVACLAALAWFWNQYTFRPFRGVGLAIVLGLIGIAAWITPSLLGKHLGIDPGAKEGIGHWLGFTPRTHGFDPNMVGEHPTAFAFTVAMRFIRLVVCVPLIEEIFWRGYLMRIAAHPNRPLHEIPFGTHSWPAFFVTTFAFTIVHHPSDYIGAAIFGSLVYLVAVRTKSLAACVLAHAVANLALGIYIMKTQQWGFW